MRSAVSLALCLPRAAVPSASVQTKGPVVAVPCPHVPAHGLMAAWPCFAHTGGND